MVAGFGSSCYCAAVAMAMDLAAALVITVVAEMIAAASSGS